MRSLGHLAVYALLAVPDGLGAQEHGGFVATLGRDTVQVERFVREGRRASGTVIVRTPAFRTIRWSMTYDDQHRPLRYEVSATDASGAPVLDAQTGSLSFEGDSILRDAYQRGQLQSKRIAAPNGALPSPGIPYIGVSYLMYEDAFNAARRRAPTATDTVIYQLTMIAAQSAPSRTRAWLIGADSAELDYFGVNRSGYRFDANGRLLRADWTSTTYKYQIRRTNDTSLTRVASAWAAAERSGAGFGALSPRDSVKGTIGSSQFTIDYSRPARRGRDLWGVVVPWDKVWRLGADMATHFTTSADLVIGETTVPAGRYTLWMVPSETAPMLVINSAVNIFGTMYAVTKDVARIPLVRSSAPNAERLTLSVHDGSLWIAWGETAWSVPVRPN